MIKEMVGSWIGISETHSQERLYPWRYTFSRIKAPNTRASRKQNINII